MNSQFKPYGRNTGAAPQFVRPGRDPAAVRMFFVMLLIALVPPIGILIAWRSSYINLRGRLILSAVASCSLTIMLLMVMDGRSANAILPTPVVPAGYGYVQPTPAPAPGGAADDAAVATDPSTDVQPDAGETQAADAAADTAVAEEDPAESTIVYAVRSNASLYHATDSCDGQVNRRVLTLREALDGGLTPCPKCYPDGQ
jgi:hypothetical protein